MKKLISIGVVLALLTLAVVPAVTAAQCDYPDGDGTGIEPDTYAKIPFAILEAGFAMVGEILDVLPEDLGLPAFVNSDLVNTIGGFAGGPLSWTVDMLGWGLSLVGSVLGSLAEPLGLPDWLEPLVNEIACGIFTPFECVVAGAPPFDPCA
ncbi:MAG: hypothetical protein ACFFEK_16925 [Candidatus Thorarchaeota archaeon]